MTRSGRRQQQGIAVIAAMLLAALTAVIVGNMVWQQQLLISELENQQQQTQAMWIADAATHWSRAILAEDAHNGKIDHAKEAWATRLPPTPVEGGDVTGFISDAQQFFNLNNLTDTTEQNDRQRATYQRLLELLSLKSELADTLIDWLDKDDDKSGAGGAESNYYLGLTPPYRAANQRLVETGNLIRVKGYDNAIIRKIAPFTTVLPDNTPININTASAEVLAFAVPGISAQEAQTIVATRNIEFFKDLADFNQRISTTSSISSANLSVNSDYFLVTCFAHYGNTRLKVETLIYRAKKAGWPIVIWKRYG